MGELKKPLFTESFSSVKDLMRIYVEGCKRRTTARMNLNEHSSRGHTVLIIRATSDYKAGNLGMLFGGGVAGDKESETACLYLVDLAGVESLRAEDTPIANTPSAAKDRMAESKSIHDNLLTLMKVISAGSDRDQKGPGKGWGGATAESKLTQLLAPALTLKSRVAMLYCLRTEPEHAEQSLAVMKLMQNDPSKVNVTEVKAKEKPAQATSADSDKKDSASAARPEDSVDAFEDAVQVIARALDSAGGGVTWPHARLMVRGSGGVGKSTTIEAMMGKTFDLSKASTVGAGMQDIELHQQELDTGGMGTAFRPYEGMEAEYAGALAAHAASLEGKALEIESTTSMLDVIKEKRKADGFDSKAPSDQGKTRSSVRLDEHGKAIKENLFRGQAVTPLGMQKAMSNETASSGHTASLESSMKATSPTPSRQGVHADEEEMAMEDIDPTPPDLSLDLLIKYRKGEMQQHLVLKVQDTGGQPIFLSILELLTTPDCTVYLVVFNLKQLQDNFASCVDNLTEQLMSTFMFAANAPVILAGTRKDEVSTDLASLSARLLAELNQRCAPAVEGLIYNQVSSALDGPSSELCFFAIENSKGLAGDSTICELVTAIEKGARSLPSMQQKVPLPWLKVYDALRRKSESMRRLKLAGVREICKQYGLPHAGLTLDEEMTAMLEFFRSLNAILWYDVPTLRNLVILDPKWVIDAATCFIRDFKLKDHTERYGRMAAIDQDAIRREPEAWSLLVDGSATLRQSLLDILWQDDDFEPHKSELLDLLTRFGLVVPVPRKADTWIVPALLRESTRPQAPFGWPARAPDAARLLLHFTITHQENRVQNKSAARMWKRLRSSFDPHAVPDNLTFEPQEHSVNGFLPIGVFHRLCAGGMGCSNQGASGPELAMDRRFAYIAIDDELVILQHMPAISSIQVFFHTNGQSNGASVLDRLRVLISQELSEYRNLTCQIYAPFQGNRETWVDLDVLAGAPRSSALVSLGGSEITVDALFKTMECWLTLKCDFYFIKADKLRKASPEDFPKMLSLQDMKRYHSDWIVKKTLSFDKACAGEYSKRYLAVSHRWESMESPDTRGKQLEELKTMIQAEPEIEFIFYDQMCLPQGLERTPEEKAEFMSMLPNINMLYLACRVLILLDRAYISRFWTQFEAWLSFQMVTSNGLQGCADRKLARNKIVTIHGAAPSLASVLIDEWCNTTHEMAYEKLGQPDVHITNPSDKDVQLLQLQKLNQLVMRIIQRSRASPTKTVPRVTSAEEKRELDELKGLFSQRPGGAQSMEAPPASSSGEAREVEGLAELLDGLKLSDKLDAARAWFAEQGIDTMAELKEAEMVGDLADAIKLKPAKKKLLMKRMSDAD